MSWRSRRLLVPGWPRWLVLASLVCAPATAAGDDPEEVLEEALAEAQAEDSELLEALDDLACEDWALDEVREAAQLLARHDQERWRRGRRRLARVSAWSLLVPRLSVALGVGWLADGRVERGDRVSVGATGAVRGPDDAGAASGAQARWTITVRMVWDLSRGPTGGG